MRAIVQYQYGDLDVLKEEEVSLPLVGDDDILIEVRATAVNPVDWKIRKGWLTDLLNYDFPLILGWDVAGVVVAVGKNINNFKIGDEVFSRPEIERNGAYADYISVHQKTVALKPSNLTFEEAAAVPLVGLTAFQALVNAAHIKEGSKVLIHSGAGGIGSIAIQIAKAFGATVATTTSTKNIDFVKSLGADVIINYELELFDEVLQDYDVVFNTLDHDILLRSYTVLKQDGILVSIYGPKGITIPKNEVAIAKNIYTEHVFTDPSGKELAKLAKLLENEVIKPIVGSIYPLTLEGVKQSHLISETEHAKGKIILTNQ